MKGHEDDAAGTLPLLRAVALGGRVEPVAVARRTGDDVAVATAELAAAERAGLVACQRDMYRITPEGRAQLDDLLAQERQGLDTAKAQELYDRFCSVNDSFKGFVTELQLAGGDPVESVGALRDIHAAATGIVADAVAIAPRLAPFGSRFGSAVEAVAAGDARYMTHPLVDSYHGIWFELHEELIHLAGRTRAAEAQQGRA